MAGMARRHKNVAGKLSSRRHRLRSRDAPEPPTSDYAEECMRRLVRILVRTGHAPQRLSRRFSDICKGFKGAARGFDPRQLNYTADLPHVITLWHTEPDYLDEQGEPKALPLRGEAPSLVRLIERVLPGENPDAVMKSLIQIRGIRRRGTLYVPTARYCIYPPDSALLHSLSTLLGMLRTVDHNVGVSRPHKLLERTAKNPNLPVSVLPIFYRRLNALAEELLRDADGEMEKYARSAATGPRTRVAVGVFVSEQPFESQPAKNGRADARPRRMRGASRERRKRGRG